jgi:hypothetical protein
VGSQFVGMLSSLNLVLTFEVVMYTGGSRVASIVLTAAAKTLSPVTTEVSTRSICAFKRVNHLYVQLGGKSPVVIDPRCDLKLTARRLMWGKFANAGQVQMISMNIPPSTGSHRAHRLASPRIMLWYLRALWVSSFEHAKKCKCPRLVG